MKKAMMWFSMLMAASVFADTWTDPATGIGWTYVIRDGEVWIGDFTGAAISVDTTGVVVIPSVIEGYPVTTIGSMSFYGCNDITSIVIPQSVTTFDDNAFTKCNGLTTITIPNSVTSISSHPFGDCKRLKEIIVERGNPTYEVRNQLLCNKCSTEVIQCPCALKSITIPSSVTEIRAYAFDGNSLMSISVASGNRSFSVENQLLCSKDGTVVVACPGAVKSVIIPPTVKRIEDFAFYNCDGLESVLIPEGVGYIGIYSFGWCGALKSVVIPSSVRTINLNAFQYCEGLETVVFCDGVSSIGHGMFAGCASLMSVSIPYSVVTSIGNNTFAFCSALSVIHVEPGDASRVKNMLSTGWILPTEKSVGDQVTIVEDYYPEPAPGPTPKPEPEEEEAFKPAHTFNGLVTDESGMCGMMQVATARRSAKGEVKVSGFVMLEDGKKQTLKAVSGKVSGGAVEVATKVGKTELSLTITDDGFTGTLGDMAVASADIGEETGIISGTLKMSYFDAKTGKVKTKNITIKGLTNGEAAEGSATVKGQNERLFEATIE